MLRRSRNRDKTAQAARRLYTAMVARAREPAFYTCFRVPDSIDGRFDLLALHAFAVMDALTAAGAGGAALGTELANLIFAGFEDALRELGVGDSGISRRMKQLAGAFYGRLEAYREAKGSAELAPVIVRNLYRGNDNWTREAEVLAPYILSVRQHLRAAMPALLDGIIDFGPVPEIASH